MILFDNDVFNGVVYMLNEVIYFVFMKNIVVEVFIILEFSILVYVVI